VQNVKHLVRRPEFPGGSWPISEFYSWPEWFSMVVVLLDSAVGER